MPWFHAVIPALLATTGVGAGAVAVLSADPPSSSAVWIDAPVHDGTVEPGDVRVVAHASATAHIDGLQLLVDGTKVDADRSLEVRGRLVYGELTWRASEVGDHEVVVRQIGGTGADSAPVYLSVPDAGPSAPTTPTPTPSASTPTPTPSEESIDPDLGPDGGDVGAALPDIAAVGFSGPARVSVRESCGDSVLVTATITGADEALVRIAGIGDVPMSTARGEQWSAEIGSGYTGEQVGLHEVSVVVPSDGTTIERAVGQLSVEVGCIG